MPENKKKKYRKPEIKRIKLDAKTAVLGFCKSANNVGPGVPNCAMPVPCSSQGS